MNENANIVTIKGETFYKVGERCCAPRPKQNRIGQRGANTLKNSL